ncbi:MBL fold metallo-hydrolase [Streptomyces olivaceoviridis]|uniref:MBL fold metallo-hydrolase n=1 Tax=Streptomyces olivaceoviridis TaxID=1921 RepID=UPI0016738DF4|nr:MBL fold metallo-hydrolase [Streptomyces olivaceoviridis]GGZ30691.1 MBL fold hydrolase [Streptomyces olivaceoviridis]
MHIGTLNRQSAVRSLVLGDVRLTYVVDGAMAMLPSGFFPGFAEDYWDAHPELLDEKGRLAMSAGGLLVERDGRRLLIDAGMGPVRGPIHVSGEPVGHSDCGALPQMLAALGHTPEDIEAVAFTHLHVDHTGWAFTPEKTFPKARYLVAAREWAPHSCGTTVPGAPTADILTLIGAAHTPIDDGEEIFPGVCALVTPGHSPGHTSYVITAGSERLVVLGDVFHTPAQLAHPEWPSRPDVDQSGVMAARKRIAAELERPGTLGFAFHFGDQAFGRLAGTDWVPVPARALFPTPRTV